MQVGKWKMQVGRRLHDKEEDSIRIAKMDDIVDSYEWY